VIGEGPAPRDVQVPGQPGDPAEYLHRLDVEVRTLRPPRGDQVIHLVAEQGDLEDSGLGVVGMARGDDPAGLAACGGGPRPARKGDAGTGALGH
jgi:hypothetical protein